MDPSKEQGKEKNEQDFIYKSCTTRSDRDAYRICPSKLTKRELEDLYFTVLEENMEQKKTISGQQDRIKSLTSKVHRMFSAQKVHQADERNDCCVSKCMMDQHKQALLELKRTNERMAERIRQLNQQLISAKQISKNRLTCSPKCPRSSPASPSLAEELSNKSVETQTDSPSITRECDENKCRTLMDELKQKIANLEQELTNTHNEYSNRMSRLEREILQFRNQETLMHRGYVLTSELQQDRNRPETDNGTREPADLKRELSKEKTAATELANQLKSVETASPSKTSESHLPTIREQSFEENKECEGFSWECNCIPVCPHSKPVCTVLRLFNKGSVCSAKHTYSVEVKTSNKINGLVTANSQDLANNHRLENEPTDDSHKDLPETMPKDSINKDGTHVSNIKQYKHKPKNEHKSSSDSNGHRAERLVNNLGNNIVIEPKDNGLSLHEDTATGAKYETSPGMEYKDLPDEKAPQNAIDPRNYSDIGDVKYDKATDDDMPKNGLTSNNLLEIPNAQDVQQQDSTYVSKTQIISTTKEGQNARSSIEMHEDKKVPKLNNIQDQIHSKTAPKQKRLSGENKINQVVPDEQHLPHTKIEANLLDTAEYVGSDRNQDSDLFKNRKEHDRSNIIADKNQTSNNKNDFVDDANRRIDDRNGYDRRVDDIHPRIDDRKTIIDKRNQSFDDRNQYTDRGTSVIDNKGQDNDKRKRSADSSQNVTPDTNKYIMESIGSKNVNLPETRFQREPSPEISNKINLYHKCGCLTTRIPDANDAIEHDGRERILNTNGKRGSMEADICNMPASDSNHVCRYAKGVQNQTNLMNTGKNTNEIQHDASTSPYLPDMIDRKGVTKADINNKIREDVPCSYEPHHQISSNMGPDSSQFQPNAYKNLSTTDTRQIQDPTTADLNRNIHTQPIYKNDQLPCAHGEQNQVSYTSNDKAQPKSDENKYRNFPGTNETQGRLSVTRNYKNGQDLSNISGPQNQFSSNIKQDKVQTLPGTYKHLPVNSQSQGKTEVDINLNVPIYKNCQNVPNAYVPNNQVISNVRQEDNQTQTVVNKNRNMPVTNQIRGETEEDMNYSTPVYNNGQDLPYDYKTQNQVNSDIRQHKLQTQPDVNRNMNFPVVEQSQGETEADMSRYLPAYKNAQDFPNACAPQNQISSNMKQEKAQTQPGVNRNLNLPATSQIQGETNADTHRNIPGYKNGQYLSNANGVQNQVTSNLDQDKVQPQSCNINVPHTNLSQNRTETYTPAYKNGQDLPYDYSGEPQNQTGSNIRQDRVQTQPGVKRNLNIPVTNQIEGGTENDMHCNLSAYQNGEDLPHDYAAQNQVGSDLRHNSVQTQRDANENVKLYNSNQGQGQIKADMTSNIANENVNDYEDPNQITSNTRQDRVATQPTANGYLNIPKNGGDMSGVYKNGKNVPLTNDAQNQSESLKNNYQNLTDNDNRNQILPKADINYNNHCIPEDSRAQNDTNSNLKNYNGQVKRDSHNRDVAVPDTNLFGSNHGPNLTDFKKHDVETQTDDDVSMDELQPYSIKDPLILAKSLTHISDAQLETIAELERQLEAKKRVPVGNNNINKNIDEDSKVNEVDNNDASLDNGNAFTKNDYNTPTIVPAKNKTEYSFGKKLPRDSIWLSKERLNMSKERLNMSKEGLNFENGEKHRTLKNKAIMPKNDQHNSLQIPGPIPSSSAQNNSWKANVLKRFNRDSKKRNIKDNTKKTKETSINTENQIDTEKHHVDTSTITGNDYSETEKEQDMYKSVEMSEKVIKLGYKTKVSRHDGLNSPTKRMAEQNVTMDPGALMVKCMELSMLQAAGTLEKNIQPEPMPELVVTSKDTIKDNIPIPTQRELKTYRNEDGTLCFETKPVTDRSRCCQCDRKIHCEDYRSEDKQQEGRNRQINTYEQGTSTTNSGEDAQCMALQKEEHRLYETPPVPPVESDINKNKRRLSVFSNKVAINISNDELPSISEIPMENKYASTEPETKNVSEPVVSNSNKISKQKRLSADAETKASPEKPTSGPDEATPTNGKRDSTSVPDPNTLPEGKMLFSDDQLSPNVPEVKKDIETTTSKSQSTLRMEEKLQALTEEIAHCKKLLLGKQPPDVKIREPEGSIRAEKKYSKSALSELDEEERLALKRGVAKHTIGDTFTPHCVFTLHVGTIVLSDEAVLTTRDKSLILTWKFYNQNVSITRMSAGRVMLFDVSSEYDVQITDEFLEYMKFEEMIISICELNNQNEAFATCALPLRDALLHTNRRADMSLELVAGPQMLYVRDLNQTSDSLDTGDEVGVIDLWCMLRVDTKLLPMIKKAMAKRTVPPKKKKEEPRIKPLIDDDDDDDDKNRTRSDSQKLDESFQDMREMDTKKLHRWGSSILRLPSREWGQPADDGESKYGKSAGKKETAGGSKVRNSISSVKSISKKRHQQFATQPEIKKQKPDRRASTDIGTQVSYTSVIAQYDPSKYPLPRVDSRQHLDESLEKEHFGHQGGILINEVIANIKTPEDMKHAMENTYRDSIHKVSRLPRNEDDIVSQAHSGSTFNFIRNWKNKRSSDKAEKSSYKSSIGSNKVRGYSRDQDFQPPLVLADEEPSDIALINRKYDNISKLYSTRPDIKKQVTINANSKYDDEIEEPQKDEADYGDEGDNMKFINQKVDITILWLALNEECEAMCNPRVQRVYVAYNFLGRSGADLETPFSLPKPKHHVDKCYFNFKKSFQVEEEDVSLLGHMARCRAASRVATDFKDCIVFSVISEPPEDPLGLDTCEDIGYAYLYLGDLLAYSAGSAGYTEVIPVRARGGSSVCGVLAVRLDGLDVLRRCATLTAQEFVPTIE